MNALLLCFAILFSLHGHAQEMQKTALVYEADIVVFSYDRPMQLYAFLESLYLHTSGIHETSVIYRCSDEEYRNAYEQVGCAFPQVKLIEQKNPPQDFKLLFLEIVFNPQSSEYVAFAVDDIIVKDDIDLSQCINALEATKAYGFYLRLGLNIDASCSSDVHDGTPPMMKVVEGIYSWQFKTGHWNWAYPNTVDMTVYRKKDLECPFRELSYYNPNHLENSFGNADLEQMGLCYETSKIVNVPLNIVSESSSTQHLNISAKDLLIKFNAGLKIDISSFFQIKNRTAHAFVYEPSFVPR